MHSQTEAALTPPALAEALALEVEVRRVRRKMMMMTWYSEEFLQNHTFYFLLLFLFQYAAPSRKRGKVGNFGYRGLIKLTFLLLHRLNVSRVRKV